MLNGGRLAGRPAELVARALALEPDNITALWLSGLAAQEAGDGAQALVHLRRARVVSEAAHQPVEDLDRAIAALDGTTAPPAAAGDAAASTGPRIEVEVAVDEALAGRIAPEATLFVVARAAGAGGPAAPLAVKRLAASALPVAVTLDDSLAMAPGINLSSAEEVMIVARVSQQGGAMPQPGDLEGTAGPVAVGGGADPVRITISKVVE